jgi:hypothetical protein
MNLDREKETSEANLREIFDLKIRLVEQRIDAMLRADETAAQVMADWKLVNNEWRKSLADSRQDTMTRAELNAKFEAIGARLDSHQTAITENRGQKAGVNSSWGLVITLIGIILTALLVWKNIQP